MQNLKKKRFQAGKKLQQRPIAFVTNGIVGKGSGPLNNGLLQVDNQIYTTTHLFIRDIYEYPRQEGQVIDVRFPYELHKFPERTAGLQLVKVPKVCLTSSSNKPIKVSNKKEREDNFDLNNINKQINKGPNLIGLENINLAAAKCSEYYNHFWYNYYQQQLHLRQQLMLNCWPNYGKLNKLTASREQQGVQSESQQRFHVKVSKLC